MLALRLRAIRAFDADVPPAVEAAARSAFDGSANIARAEMGLEITAHPAASPIEIELGDRHLELRAETGSAGPGHHENVCAFADRVGDLLGLRWTAVEDSASFFVERSRARLEAYVLSELQKAAIEILQLSARGASGFALFLPEGLEVHHEGLVATLLGPRERAWVERVADDPRAGIDAFPCWSKALDARYFLFRALARMWLDIRWRPPIDDAERAVMLETLADLERAFALAPSLDLPWVEWAELFDLMGEDSLRATRVRIRAERARHAQRTSVGYRRRAVRVRLSGDWSIAIPGEMAERWDERGTWHATDGRRSLWVTTAEAPAGSSTERTLGGLPPLPGEGEVFAMERGAIRGAVRFEVRRDGSVPLLAAHAHAAVGPHLAVGTLTARDEDDRALLLEIWGTLDHPDAAARSSRSDGI